MYIHHIFLFLITSAPVGAYIRGQDGRRRMYVIASIHLLIHMLSHRAPNIILDSKRVKEWVKNYDKNYVDTFGELNLYKIWECSLCGSGIKVRGKIGIHIFWFFASFINMHTDPVDLFMYIVHQGHTVLYFQFSHQRERRAIVGYLGWEGHLNDKCMHSDFQGKIPLQFLFQRG